jgi:DNA-binding CsgD family transcriptional regulator
MSARIDEKAQLSEDGGDVKEGFEEVSGSEEMLFLALSHTSAEHDLYLTMLEGVRGTNDHTGRFEVRRLMSWETASSYSSLRRAFLGLVRKMSIQPVVYEGREQKSLYKVFLPGEIFARRVTAGLSPYPEEVGAFRSSYIFALVAGAVIGKSQLSRREALVTLLCAEGMSNQEIGQKLSIDEKTVKYHMRHVFMKLGVRRRAELVSKLLRDHTQGQEKSLAFDGI